MPAAPPFRPNHLGLSSVKLENITYDAARHPILTVSGADLISGTPIYDIKPYIKFTDCHEDAVSGFADTNDFPSLEVEINDEWLNRVPKEKHETLFSILKSDPRPAYQHDEDRVYGFRFADYEIRFSVKGTTLTVVAIEGV